MLNIDYKDAAKTALTDLVVCMYSPKTGWWITDKEFDEVINEQKYKGFNFSFLLADRFRMTTDTERLISKGFVCLDGEAYFETEEAAFAWIKQNVDCDYKNWSEVCMAAKNGDIKNCYYNDCF